ncbi:hypothetical protein BMS3Bbin02_01262 [bacterium BMS3Bbin02]|nr:hypothetical protein BMS3Bbin02_01262 [bacterium BMS3Bbin02]
MEIVPFLTELVGFERRKPAKRHVENVIGLDKREIEPAHQPPTGNLDVRGLSDDLDDLVDVVQRDQQTLDDVCPFLGFPETEGSPTFHDLELVIHVVVNHRSDTHCSRNTVDQCNAVHRKRVLKLGVPKQHVELDLGPCVAFQFDDKTGLFPRLVTQVGDPGYDFAANEISNLRHNPVARDLVRDLGYNNRGPSFANLHDVGDGTHPYGPTTG